jgi:serine-type D-Ala-D-Ala carboxypeptidase (penicillin-binding protein 5/6)
VPVSYLQGGRRRRRFRGPLLVLLALLVAGGAFGVWQAAGGRKTRKAARPRVVHHAAAPRLAPLAKVTPRVRPSAPEPLVTARRPLAHGPKIAARAGVLLDASTGTVLVARHPHLRLPIASTTKIMTATLALERLRPGSIVTIERSVPRVAPFREGLRAGERVEAWKLFYGLLLYSGNDDALALAIGAAGSRPAFVKLMNEKARELGLHDSHFRSPSGVIDRDNYSSAWDLAALARYAMRNPRFRAIVRTRVKRVAWPKPTYSKVYVNKNHLLGAYRGANGIKTGWTTKAGHCLVASATRHGIRLIAVVLGSPDAYTDTKRLLDYGFSTRG